MSSLIIPRVDGCSIEVVARESDKHSSLALFSIGHIGRNQYSGPTKVFMTPDQLEELGKFLIQRAQILKSNNGNTTSNI